MYVSTINQQRPFHSLTHPNNTQRTTTLSPFSPFLLLQEDAPEAHRVWEKANPLAQDGGAMALNRQQQQGTACVSFVVSVRGWCG